MKLTRPQALRQGDTIGVFTPSFPAHVVFREKYLHGLGALRQMGFQVVEGSLTARASSSGYRSGSPTERAAEFMDLVRDPNVHGLITTIGGQNSSSLLPHLDFDVIRAHPKVICGYSDVTALLMAILTQAGLSTFYGPALVPSFGEWPTIDAYTRESFLDAVTRRAEGPRRLLPPALWSNHFRDAKTAAWRTETRRFETNEGWRTLVPGAAEGPAIVANLNTLLALAGTRYFPPMTGVVLVMEQMDVRLSREERQLRQLEAMGVFDEIQALVVGKPETYEAEGAPFTYEELLREVLGGERSIPVVTNFDCGHTVPMLTLAQGCRISIHASENEAQITVDEPMVT
jgi:muramoyltetrapeptide carboxypeptidase